MLDESTTVVDGPVCVKPLPAKVSPPTKSPALRLFVSLRNNGAVAIECCNSTAKMLWTQQTDLKEPARV